MVLLVVPLLSGCESLGYYSQAASGHLELMRARRGVDAVIADPATPAPLRERLTLTRSMLEFAETELSLPAAGQYQHVVELDRDAVVYNVMAAPRYGFEPVLWCFPIAGCVAYRGYFQRSRADAKAADLAASGLDVYVGGAAAYSTLGWFSDPLLSTFLWREEADLAELLFHELAHVRVYLPGDTTFNESFATFVGREGADRWLQRHGRDEERSRWQAQIRVRKDFVRFVLGWRERMAERYRELAADGADEERLEAEREELWTAMRSAWLEQRDGEAARYDGFFSAAASNARLNAVADYHGQLDAFATLFAAEGRDFEAFYAAVEDLAALSTDARQAALAELAADQDRSR